MFSILFFLSFRILENDYILVKSSKFIIVPCLHVYCWRLLLVNSLRPVFFRGTVTKTKSYFKLFFSPRKAKCSKLFFDTDKLANVGYVSRSNKGRVAKNYQNYLYKNTRKKSTITKPAIAGKIWISNFLLNNKLSLKMDQSSYI